MFTLKKVRGSITAAVILASVLLMSPLSGVKAQGVNNADFWRDLARTGATESLREFLNEGGLPFIGDHIADAIHASGPARVSAQIIPFTCGNGATANWARIRPEVLSVNLGNTGDFTQRAGYRINLRANRNPGGFRLFACAFDALEDYPLNTVFVQLTHDRGTQRRVVPFSSMNPHEANQRTPATLHMRGVPGNWRVVSITNDQLQGRFGTRSFIDRINVYATGDGRSKRGLRFGTFYIRHQHGSSPATPDVATFTLPCVDALNSF